MTPWFARFRGGPYDRQTRTFPEGMEPPDELVMVELPAGAVTIDGALYEANRDAVPHADEDATRYRKVPGRQSQLPADHPLLAGGAMVRGVEYELAPERSDG